MSAIYVIAENAQLACELVGGAKEISKSSAQVIAFVAGDEAAAKEAIAAGAEAAFALPLAADAMWEEYTPVIAEKAKAEGPQVILISATKRGRTMAGQLAGLLDAPCVSDCKSITIDGGTITASRMVFGGLALKTMTTSAPIVVATVGAKTFELPAADASRSGAVSTLAPAAGKAKVVARQPKEKGEVNLGEATRVVGVGRGYVEQSELSLAKDLAAAMGAEVACTRPIAEFFKWMPEECYLGISGQVIKPLVYFATGVSGQAQHIYGVRDSKVIVSVNKDENAPINGEADYYFLGDIKEVLPVITKAFKDR
ncbi:FAD-binding protein [Fundidesulfovibrio butyratiphilus]